MIGLIGFIFPILIKNLLLGNGLLIMDKASNHIDDDIIEKCSGNLKDVSILPIGCMIILQP